MTEYRDVKRPTSLVSRELTEDELAIVASGNEASIGTDIGDDDKAGQLDLWYEDKATLVAATRNGAALMRWAFSGHVSPRDCRLWYRAKVKA